MINIRNNHINEIGALVLFATYYYVFSIDTNNESYVQSKYWLGLNIKSIYALIPLQIISAIGFVVWMISVRNNPPKKGLLSYKFLNNPMYEVLVLLLVVGAIMWPLTLLQNNILGNKTLFKTIICCFSLLICSVAGILMQAGSYEGNISAAAIIGITLFNSTVVLGDGIGWSSRLIHQTLYS